VGMIKNDSRMMVLRYIGSLTDRQCSLASAQDLRNQPRSFLTRAPALMFQVGQTNDGDGHWRVGCTQGR
jgi:hypothetical protein